MWLDSIVKSFDPTNIWSVFILALYFRFSMDFIRRHFREYAALTSWTLFLLQKGTCIITYKSVFFSILQNFNSRIIKLVIPRRLGNLNLSFNHLARLKSRQFTQYFTKPLTRNKHLSLPYFCLHSCNFIIPVVIFACKPSKYQKLGPIHFHA